MAKDILGRKVSKGDLIVHITSTSNTIRAVEGVVVEATKDFVRWKWWTKAYRMTNPSVTGRGRYSTVDVQKTTKIKRNFIKIDVVKDNEANDTSSGDTDIN